jgi:site-specific recombinase XerD
MYSPKIPERFIPVLYRHAKQRGIPMTIMVAEALDQYLAAEARGATSVEADGYVLTDQGRRLLSQQRRAA